MMTWQNKGTFAASADYDADNRIRHLVGYTLPADDSGVQLVGLVMDGAWGASTQEEGGQLWMTSLARLRGLRPVQDGAWGSDGRGLIRADESIVGNGLQAAIGRTGADELAIAVGGRPGGLTAKPNFQVWEYGPLSATDYAAALSDLSDAARQSILDGGLAAINAAYGRAIDKGDIEMQEAGPTYLWLEADSG